MGWFGEAVGGGGRVAGRAAENRAASRTEVAKDLLNEARIRQVNTENENRAGRATMSSGTFSGANPLILPPLVNVPPPPTPPATVAPPPATVAPPPVTGAPTGVHTGGFTSLRPSGSAQQQAYIRQLGRQNSQTLGTNLDSYPSPQSNQNPNPVGDQGAGVVSRSSGGRFRGRGGSGDAMGPDAPVVQSSQNVGYGDVTPPQKLPAMTVTAKAPRSYYAERNEVNHNLAQTDRQIQIYRDKLEQMRPYAKSQYGHGESMKLQGEIQKLTLARNEMVFSDALNIFQATGDPGRLAQVMAAKGQNVKFTDMRDGTFVMSDVDGGRESTGTAAQLVDRIRIAYSPKLRDEQRAAFREVQLQRIKNKGGTDVALISERARTAVARIAGRKAKVKADGYGGAILTQDGLVYKISSTAGSTDPARMELLGVHRPGQEYTGGAVPIDPRTIGSKAEASYYKLRQALESNPEAWRILQEELSIAQTEDDGSQEYYSSGSTFPFN